MFYTLQAGEHSKPCSKLCFICYRLENIACDAELQEKSQADLQRLGEVLAEGCAKALEEEKAKKEEESQNNALPDGGWGSKTKIYC